jgi:hypothetical protein
MDPSRTPLSPGSLKRRRVSPAAEHLSMVPPGHQQQPTSLPSIRQLHPYLPPSSGVSQSLSPEISGYPYPGPSPYSPQAPHADAAQSHATSASQRDPATLVGESEADDLELQSPPKKKRRRQALSCTGDYLLALHSFSSDLLHPSILRRFFLILYPSPFHSFNMPLSLAVIRMQKTKDQVRQVCPMLLGQCFLLTDNSLHQNSALHSLHPPRRTAWMPVAYRRTYVSLSLFPSSVCDSIISPTIHFDSLKARNMSQKLNSITSKRGTSSSRPSSGDICRLDHQPLQA